MAETYVLTGEVVHGKGLGRTVGMPTANLQLDGTCVMPTNGVYATYIYVDGKGYPSVTNIGTRPSVDRDEHITVETYIMEFGQDIYGKQVKLELVEFLRPIQTFANLEQVMEQVKKDIENAKKYLDMQKSK